MQVGDKVVCIWPGCSTGPDCIVGAIFKIKEMNEHYGPLALVFDCHPYHDSTGRVGMIIGAHAHRFSKYEEQGQLTTASTGQSASHPAS